MAQLLCGGVGGHNAAADWTVLTQAAAVLCPKSEKEAGTCQTMVWVPIRMVPSARVSWAMWKAQLHIIHQARLAEHQLHIKHTRAVVAAINDTARTFWPLIGQKGSEPDAHHVASSADAQPAGDVGQ